MTHSWCRDIPRDEAVRAAEDGRDGPLPTLEAVIAQPFAEPAKCSPAVSETGERQSGMRTERVTLEVKHGNSLNFRDWPSLKTVFGESVRVVEEAIPPAPQSRPAETRQTSAGMVLGGPWFPASDKPAQPPPPAPPRAHRGSGVFDANGESHLEAQRGVIDTLTRQRDAAIRERDEHKEEYYKLRAERITQALTADRFAAAVAEADRLRARVAELESAPAASGWLTESERGALERAFDLLCDDDGDNPLAGRVRRLLARSTPPEVVLPGDSDRFRYGDDAIANRDRQWLAALAAAGVTVKEVG